METIVIEEALSIIVSLSVASVVLNTAVPVSCTNVVSWATHYAAAVVAAHTPDCFSSN
jgi:hypothetical protein